MARLDYSLYGYKYLRFSKNWNNKLYCQFFTTVRRVGKFRVGDMLRVECGSLKYDAVVESISTFSISGFTDRIALLDSGLHKNSFLNMIFKLYGPQKELDVLVVQSMMSVQDFENSFK